MFGPRTKTKKLWTAADFKRSNANKQPPVKLTMTFQLTVTFLKHIVKPVGTPFVSQLKAEQRLT